MHFFRASSWSLDIIRERWFSAVKKFSPLYKEGNFFVLDKDEIMEAVYNSIHDDLSRTDVDYINLMEKYSKDIGRILYDMENHGYDLSSITLSFFDKAQESFEMLLYRYIEIHFEELEKDCLCQ